MFWHQDMHLICKKDAVDSAHHHDHVMQASCNVLFNWLRLCAVVYNVMKGWPLFVV